MRFSLRELLLIAGAASLAVPAFCYANGWVRWAMLAVTAGLLLRAGHRSLVERGQACAAAIGFAAVAGLYAALVLTNAETKSFGGPSYRELDPYAGRLPTTFLMQKPLEAIWSRRSYWLDPQGKRSDNPPPPGANKVWGSGGFGGGGLGGGFSGPVWQRIEIPSRYDAMTVAHCLWTLLLGYAGGKYGAHVYARRAEHDRPDAKGDA